MINKLSVYIPNNHHIKRYSKALIVNNLNVTSNIDKADVVIFTGGEDVSPRLYKEERHPSTRCNSMRDRMEMKTFEEALDKEKVILGICRGAQFVTVMNGGKLIQHVENHSGQNHFIKTKASTYSVNSTHHQMMYPYNLISRAYDIVGFSESRSNVYWKNHEEQYDMRGLVEPEIVNYIYTKSLCVQFHPETMLDNQRAKQFVTNYLKVLL